MKKILVTLFISLFAFSAINAQTAKEELAAAKKFEKGSNTIGLRFAPAVTEISYQKMLGKASRLEANVGLYYVGGLDISLGYQRLNKIAIADADFRWYYGAGLNLGVYGSAFLSSVYAQIGIEYNFSDLPLALSLDYRPAIRITPNFRFVGDGISIGVRYRF